MPPAGACAEPGSRCIARNHLRTERTGSFGVFSDSLGIARYDFEIRDAAHSRRRSNCGPRSPRSAFRQARCRRVHDPLRILAYAVALEQALVDSVSDRARLLRGQQRRPSVLDK